MGLSSAMQSKLCLKDYKKHYVRQHSGVYPPLSDGSNSPPQNTGNCKPRRREAAIAEGKKPLRLGSLTERRKLPQRGLGRSPRNRRDFEQFSCNMEYIWALPNLVFCNNPIEKRRINLLDNYIIF